jgi:hypothetical protein
MKELVVISQLKVPILGEESEPMVPTRLFSHSTVAVLANHPPEFQLT